MSNETFAWPDHEDHLIEEFGISLEECEDIFGQMNGVMPDMRYPLPPGYLKMELLAGAAASADDHARYGLDMSFPRRDSPEAPALLAKLAQKVGALAPWQQDAIAYYALGFWGGIGTAAREREELLASSNAVPQGAADN